MVHSQYVLIQNTFNSGYLSILVVNLYRFFKMTVVVRDVVKVSMRSRLNFAILYATYIILKSQMKYK